MIQLAAAALLLASPERDPCQVMRDAMYEGLDDNSDRPVDASGDGLWIGGIAFTASDLESVIASESEVTETWGITLTFSPSGHAKFREAQRCGVDNVIEISFDRRLISRPVLREEVLGNQVRIDSDFTQQSASELADRMRPAR